ncbi:MAG: hypothetical protein H6Q33_3077 [Deltaproteobacteria bacterium]|nr:hypothetical protein [Deltaproteobacteria bacterium]
MTDLGGALAGIRVLDLADVSGAYCGKLLADMGADVVLIEPPAGAQMRRIGPFYGGTTHPNRSIFFWHYSTNKRSVCLDLETPGDRARFLELAAAADVVVETGAPGSLDARGLGHAELARHQPGITVVSVTPFGQTGPYRNFRAADIVLQAVGGMIYPNGFPDEPPLQGLGLQAYQSASMQAAIATLLALLVRQHTGRGQWIDVSIQESVAASLEHASSRFHHDGTIVERQGSLHWTGDFRAVRCRDGYALHGTLCDWTTLIEWLKADGKAQDLGDPAWEDVQYRRTNCRHLFDVLDAWASDHAVTDLVEAAQLRRIPYAPLLAPEALPDHPQLMERRFFVPVRHDELERRVLYPGAPYIFSRTPWRLRHRPPLIGEHTDDVFAEWAARRTPPVTAVASPEGAVAPQIAPSVTCRGGRVGHDARRDSAEPPSTSLRGVRVIDFTWVIAGPVATRVLADHGAEVIKIERRDTPELGSRRAGLIGNLNRGKQSLVVNMNVPQGLALVQQLIAAADVVVDNFSARVMSNWGLDYAGLRRLKPDIIALSMSGFGQTGPYRDFVSYGPTLQAMAGYSLTMRHPGGEPAGWGFSYSDMAAGHAGALAILIALWHRQRTGEGQYIDLSQFENLTALLGPIFLEVLAQRRAVGALDNGSQERPAAPHGVYRCADLPGAGPARDRWCAIAVFGEAEWTRFRGALGNPRWAMHDRFSNHEVRILHRTALDTHITAWTKTRRAEDVMTTLQAADIAAGVVANAADLCRDDPHLQARGYWARIATPEGECPTFDRPPFLMSQTPGGVRGPGPLLGEHTDTVLQRVLGVTGTALGELRAAGVIA